MYDNSSGIIDSEMPYAFFSAGPRFWDLSPQGRTTPPAAPFAAAEASVLVASPAAADDPAAEVVVVPPLAEVVVAKLVGVMAGVVLVAVARTPPPARKLAFVPRVSVHAEDDGVAVRRASPKGREAVMVVPNLPLSTSMPTVKVPSEPPAELEAAWSAGWVVDDWGSLVPLAVVVSESEPEPEPVAAAGYPDGGPLPP
ncbi:hypothetical protein VP1G_00857 [Cytospora mali]|uniref:Uncharacterized protein n=1 Tax=Cytospora mali TaxID=578113 RepID=A0A194UP53_CYTMA|nr:hypothetical protein VP1G_00857 [Valsa mali var. pyri (nom. inval.)]